jgi:phosphatidylserine/phosphatidylglycerophosphate/cardiolipin synthase-like enzyme
MPDALLKALWRNNAIFCGIANLVAGARARVELTSFVFDGRGWQSRVVRDALNAAADRGVRVRILTSMSQIIMHATQKEMLNSFVDGLSEGVEVRVVKHYLLDTMHIKLLCVDSTDFAVMGANIQPYMSYCHWKDAAVHYREGDGMLEEVFETLWSGGSKWRRRTPRAEERWAERACSPDDTLVIEERAQLAVVWHDRCATCIRNRRETPLIRAVLSAIEGAQRTVDFVTPNLGCTRIIGALERAGERGVRIRAVTSMGHNDYYNKLLSIYTNGQSVKKTTKYVESRTSSDAGAACDVPERPLIGTNHSKFMVVDGGDEVLIGSMNFEPLSVTYSAELNVRLRGLGPRARAAFARLFGDFFEEAVAV